MADEPHTGAMVALVPSDEDAERLALEDGEDVDELHCTLLFLGEADDLDEDTRKAITAAVAELAGEYDPFDADGFAIALFNPASTERDPCVVLGLSGVDLAGLHHELVDQVEGMPAAQIEQRVNNATKWLADKPEHMKLAAMLDLVGMNLKNLK